MRRLGGVLAAGICLAACAGAGAPSASSANAYADFLVGRVANLRSDHEAAAERYFAALARDPHDPVLLEGAVLAALDAGDLAGARRAARMASGAETPAYARLVRASDALARGRWRAAGEEIDLASGGAAEELIARMMAVWTRVGERRVDEVTVDLAQLSQIRPYGALFAYQQALALDYAGREEEALAAYDLARRGGLWLPAGIERHADLLVRRGLRAEAIALLGGEQNRANPALSAALQRVVDGGRASTEPITPAHGAAVALYGLSAIFFQENDPANGLAALSLAMMLDPDFDGARLAFAQHQARLNHPELARAALAGIARSSPYARSARVMEAWILFGADQHEAALALARANAEGGDPVARRALADMYRNLGRFSEAEPLYSDLIAGEEGEWRLYFARGALRERLGRWREAEADLMRALELAPQQPDVMNYLGYSWVDRGEKLQEGLALIQRAVELRPNSGAIVDSLGWAHYRLGDYAQALGYLERAVELSPADATLNDHLGDVYWRLGRRIEARFQWRRALNLGADNEAETQAKLERGLPPEESAHAETP